MKKLLPLILVFLLGCTGTDPAMDAALALRSRVLAAETIRFTVAVGADYITNIEEFSLECVQNGEVMSFRVREPEEIEAISGTVRGSEGTVGFDETVLAFPLMAEGRLSPLSGPWVLVKALRTGHILAAGREGELIHLFIDDSYEDNALTLDIWLEEGWPTQAEISWEGRRCLTMTFDDFSA